MYNVYQTMTEEELLADFDADDEYFLERDTEICRRAGLEDDWQEADGNTFEAILSKAVDILRGDSNG